MGTGWDTTDDVLEKLLEFDDLDPLYAPNDGRETLPSNPSSILARVAESGLAARDPKVANPCKSPERLQAPQQKQSNGDDETFHLDLDSDQNSLRASGGGCKDDEPNLQADFSRAALGLSVPSSSRKRQREGNDAEGSSDRMRVSKNGAVNQNNVTGPMLSKQRSSRGLLDTVHSWEEGMHRIGDEDERLLNGLANDKRAPNATAAACLGSLQETRVPIRAGHTVCQDKNVETGRLRNDSIGADEVAQRIMGCNEREASVDGRRSEVVISLSSRGPSGAQEGAEDGDSRQVLDMGQGRNCSADGQRSLPPTVLGYKIPGPAGALQSWVRQNGQKTPGLRHSEKDFGPGRACERAMVAADALDFREGPWLAAMEYLNDGDPKFGESTWHPAMLHCLGFLPPLDPAEESFHKDNYSGTYLRLVAVIMMVLPSEFGDLSVTLKDPTGTMDGSIHRRILTELEDGHLISPGAVIVLRKVAVFSPTPRTHYLNITINNVDRIVGKHTIAVRSAGNAANDNFRNNNSSTRGRDHSTPLEGLNDISQLQSAPREDDHSELVPALNCDKSERQGVTELNLTLGNGERGERHCPSGKSPKFGKKVRSSPSLPSILEEAVDLRSCAATAKVGSFVASDPKNLLSDSQPRAKTSHEAIAKAAGYRAPLG